MKFFVVALFVALATAAPLEDDNGPVEVIVNGVPEGEPIDLSDIVDIKLKEHTNGVVTATNLLHPFTAVGIAEAAAATVSNNADASIDALDYVPIAPVSLPSPPAPEVVIAPEPVVLPVPAAPEVVYPVPVLPEPVVLPVPAAPEVVNLVPVVPEPVVLPSPAAPEVVISEAVIPEPVVLPAPVVSEVVEPVPASLPTGEIFNDGTVSVTINTPQVGVLSTIQGWFSMVLNYFNAGVQATQQIV